MGAARLIENDPETALVAIGDVHGCRDLLVDLIAKIERKMAGQAFRTVFLGDYIDRGPDSRGVIEELLAYRARRPDTVFLKGNHEQAMLDFLASPADSEAWLSWGGEETMASYGISVETPLNLPLLQIALARALPDAHFDFLMSLQLCHREQDFVFVHAGLNPDRPIDQQQEDDMLWIRDRFFDGGAGRFDNLTVVHGHTPVRRAQDLRWRVNVDTGAVWSRRLSAVVLKGGRRSFIST